MTNVQDILKADPSGARPLWLALVGFVVGALIHVLAENLFEVNEALSLAGMIGVLGIGASLAFASESKEGAPLAGRLLGLFAFSLVLGLAVAGLSYAYGSVVMTETYSDPDYAGKLLFSNAIIAFIAIVFFRTTFVRRRGPNDYHSLFELAWNMLVIGVVAGIFGFITFVILQASGAMFRAIGIPGPSDFLNREAVFPIVFFTAFGAGVGIVRERESLVLALRTVVFALVRAIGPILLIASLVFVPLYVAGGAKGLQEGWSTAGLLISIVVLGVIHLNAILGDGTQEKPPGPLSNIIARLQGLVLPALMAIAALAIWTRIQEYGLTPDRVIAAIVASVGGLYAVVYGLGSLLPKGFAFIRSVNVWLAGILALIIAVVQTPLLSPEQLSVNDRLARLQSGVEKPELELGALKLLMGRPGLAAYNRVRGEAEAANDTTLLAAFAKADELEGVWDLRNLEGVDTYSGPTREQLITNLQKYVVLYPEGTSLPVDLTERMTLEPDAKTPWRERRIQDTLSNCSSVDGQKCYLRIFEATEGMEARALFVTSYNDLDLDLMLILKTPSGWMEQDIPWTGVNGVDRADWERNGGMGPFGGEPEDVRHERKAAFMEALRTGTLTTRTVTITMPDLAGVPLPDEALTDALLGTNWPADAQDAPATLEPIGPAPPPPPRPTP